MLLILVFFLVYIWLPSYLVFCLLRGSWECGLLTPAVLACVIMAFAVTRTMEGGNVVVDFTHSVGKGGGFGCFLFLYILFLSSFCFLCLDDWRGAHSCMENSKVPRSLKKRVQMLYGYKFELFFILNNG